MRSRKKVQLSVGQDIKTPLGVSRSGRMRLRSAEAVEVATWFGLGSSRGVSRRRKRTSGAVGRLEVGLVELNAGTITLLTGASGAGKSSLLRELRKRHSDGVTWIDLASLRLGNVPIVNCFDDRPLVETLRLLGRVGLGEAWSYLRTPLQLSEGQRFRLKLAMGLHRVETLATEVASPRAVLVWDEFAATLDRLTAMIVARCVRRTSDAHPHVAAVLATSHDDLVDALAPETIVRCDFGRVEMVNARGTTR